MKMETYSVTNSRTTDDAIFNQSIMNIKIYVFSLYSVRLRRRETYIMAAIKG